MVYFQDVIRDHPVGPVAHDPLAQVKPERDCGLPGESMPSRIGFACHWEEDEERTWSGSAFHLRAALRRTIDTVDIGVRVQPTARTALRALHTRYYGGRVTSTWVYSGLTDRYVGRCLQQGLRRNQVPRPCDAVLVIDDLAALPLPFFTYYDSSWDMLIAAVDSPRALATLRAVTPAIVARRRERQISVYDRAHGVITMSRWQARCLVEQSGVPPEKIHVVPPAIKGQIAPGATAENGPPRLVRPLPERNAPRHRLLFVGRQHQSYDFYRKGGDLVVAALAILRRDYDPRTTLTVAGLGSWPLPGELPDGVRMLGAVPPEEVMALYDSHDVFVMPSRMEPYGLVFAEAQARGLPCIARAACAMPEIVVDGLSGALIKNDDPEELAAAIARVLADDAMYQSCARRALAMACYFSWDRAAADVTRAIGRGLASAI